MTEHFEVRDGYALSQPSGNVTLAQAVAAVTNAIVAAREQGVRRLLVDGTRLTGFSSPSVAERYFIVKGFVEAAGGWVELSLALQEYLLDPDRFGILVASNMGMRANVFTSPEEALEWLLSGRP